MFRALVGKRLGSRRGEGVEAPDNDESREKEADC